MPPQTQSSEKVDADASDARQRLPTFPSQRWVEGAPETAERVVEMLTSRAEKKGRQ